MSPEKPEESHRAPSLSLASFDLMGDHEEQPEVLTKCAACEETQTLCDHYKTQIGTERRRLLRLRLLLRGPHMCARRSHSSNTLLPLQLARYCILSLQYIFRL